MKTALVRGAVAMAASLVIAGCTGAGSKTPSTVGLSGSPSTSATTSSPPPSSITPEDQAAQDAEKVLRQYYPTLSTCMADPPKSKDTCFDGVAIAGELADRKNALYTARQQGTRAVGEGRIESMKVLGVDLTNKPHVTPPTVPTVKFEICYDVSHLDIVDSSGKSVVSATRAARGVQRVVVENYRWPDRSRWRVGVMERLQGRTC